MIRRTLISLGAVALLSATAGAQARTVTVTASEFTFAAPDSIAAGQTTFQLVNRGTELHHMQIVKLDAGKTFADFEASLKNPGPPPSWLSFVGGPNAGIPDGQSMVQVTASLSAGEYVLLCMIPSPDGKPHLMKGMYRPLRVTGTGVTQAGAPTADYVLTLNDYNFDFDKPLKAGTRTIQIKNSAKQWHEAVLVRLPPNVPVTAFMEWLGTGMKGQPPVIPMGGIVALTPGRENLLTVTLEPGEYGLYCFLPAPDGKEHIAHGMFKQITVSK